MEVRLADARGKEVTQAQTVRALDCRAREQWSERVPRLRLEDRELAVLRFLHDRRVDRLAIRSHRELPEDRVDILDLGQGIADRLAVRLASVADRVRQQV